MSKKNKGEKKGFFGRLFGAGKEGEAGAEGGAGATPPGQGGDPGELTMAPGYAPGDGGDLTMMPGYAHAPANSSDTGHVSFGTGRHARPAVPAPAPFDAEAPERTIAPGYAAGDDDDGLGELTMAPGYMPSKPGAPDTFADPFASGSAPGAAAPADPFAAPGAGADPFADLGGGADMMTMAPGYAAGGPAAAPSGPGPGRGGKKQAPPADPFADLGQGELTMAPGYIADVAAAKGGAPAGAADPFADFDLGAPTAAAPAPADPFADLGAGELTMAPGYAPGSAAHPAPLAGGKAGKKGAAPPPADPFVDLGDLGQGDFTMAPGYAGGKKGAAPPPVDPFGDLGPELTAPPSYGAGAPKRPLAADPFADLEVEPPQDPAMTMAPMYAPKVPIPGPTAGVGDPFDIDLGGPAIAADAFEFDPAPPQPAKPARTAAERAASPSSSSDGEAFDPFGPALLDDPFADASGAAPVATPAPAAGLPPVATPLPPSTPLAALPAAGDEDDDFRGERTMVDLNTDVEMLATLESTDELKAVPAELELDPELDLDLGGGVAAPPPVAALPPTPTPTPMAVPPRAAPRARAMFASTRPEGGGVRHVGAAPEVVLDAARGTVLAPRLEGGWTGVPQGFAVLSDGSVIGRGQVHGRDVVVLGAPTASEAEVRLAPFPAGVKVDRVTRAVLWPSGLEAQLAWRPSRMARTDEGLSFVLPEGARFEEDGSVVLPPATATAPTVAPRDPSHGAVAARFEFLGVVEEVHDDGWSRLTLPAGAMVEGERLLLPAPARRDGAPALLRPERLPDGRLALALPARAQQGRDGAVWVPPSAAPAEVASEPWADRDAAVVDTRTYAGVREEALADGWLRLELPDGARVERAGGRPRVVIPAEFGRLGDPAALLELDRLPCGSLAFDLPADAECLGTRVLVPPASTEMAPAPRPTTSGEKRPSTRVEGAPAITPVAEVSVDEPRGGDKTDPSSRKMKALDRFRNKEKKPQGDSMTFDGVLRGQADVAPTGGAVAEGVPVPAVDPVVEEPVAVVAAVETAAVEAGAAEDELGPATSAASSDASTAPEVPGPATDAAEPDELGPAVETTEATESGEGDVADDASRRTGRKKKRKGKKGDGGDA